MDWKKLYNSWKTGQSWRDLLKKKAPEVAPELPELPEVREATKAPEAKVEAKAETPVNIADLQNSITALRKENSDLKAQLENKQKLMDALKRSIGIMPASQIVETPTLSDQHDPVEHFDALPDGPEKSEFYRKHREALLPNVTKKA
jgi:predicted nuclease with TOPRIM domain